MVDSEPVVFTLWDTAGREEYIRLRPLSYPETNVFLVCFSVDSQASLDNVRSKWVPEIQHHCPDTPMILVGTKSDLRGEASATTNPLSSKNLSMVNKEEVMIVAKEVNAVEYHECSALVQDSLKNVFDSAIYIGLQHKLKQKSNCSIL